MKTIEPHPFNAVMDDEAPIRKPLTSLLDTAGLGVEFIGTGGDPLTRFLRWWIGIQINLTAASLSAALGLPALRCFVSRVFTNVDFVPSNEVGTLAAVLICRLQMKWDSIRALAFRGVFANGLVLRRRFLLDAADLARTHKPTST